LAPTIGAVTNGWANSQASATRGGAKYYFASADDKAEFDKSPAKYAPQYEGELKTSKLGFNCFA